jgi:multicomponent K+:H+ antiporter subunit A
VARAAAAVTGTAGNTVHLAIWHGFTPALWMSVIATAGGIGLVFAFSRVDRWRLRWPRPEASILYQRAVDACIAAARWCTERLHTNELQRYMACMLVAVLAVCAYAFLGGTHQPGTREPLAPSSVALTGWLVLAAACALAALRHHDRLLLLILTGAAGLIVSLAFALFSAPDLALTQISVEVVAVILLLLALNRMPKTTPREAPWLKRSFDGLVSVLGGLATAAAAYAVSTRHFESISSYHLAQSKPAGGGTNVVNVILVDFRALDTFGEIIVLGIAGVAIVALLDSTLRSGAAARYSPLPEVPENGLHSPIVVIGTRLLLPLVLTAALYIFLRGHNLPGGGFIAGIVVAIAFIMQYVASGYDWAHSRAPLEPELLIGGGTLLAGLVGVGAWALGYPLLTSAHGSVQAGLLGQLQWSSALLFDLGVFASVVGAVLVSLATLSRVKAVVPDASHDRFLVSVPATRAPESVPSIPPRRRESA